MLREHANPIIFLINNGALSKGLQLESTATLAVYGERSEANQPGILLRQSRSRLCPSTCSLRSAICLVQVDTQSR